MPYILARFAVEDYAKWKPVFDEAATLRKAHGSKGVRVFRRVDEPEEIVVIGEYEDLERARQLFQSQEFREAAKRGGLSGPPVVSFLDEVGRLPA